MHWPANSLSLFVVAEHQAFRNGGGQANNAAATASSTGVESAMQSQMAMGGGGLSQVGAATSAAADSSIMTRSQGTVMGGGQGGTGVTSQHGSSGSSLRHSQAAAPSLANMSSEGRRQALVWMRANRALGLTACDECDAVNDTFVDAAILREQNALPRTWATGKTLRCEQHLAIKAETRFKAALALVPAALDQCRPPPAPPQPRRPRSIIALPAVGGRDCPLIALPLEHQAVVDIAVPVGSTLASLTA